MTKTGVFFILLLLIWSCASGLKLPNPTKKVSESSEYENERIHEAITLHDQSRFSEAIEIYQDILIRNPDNIFAIYELSFSYFQSGQIEKSLEWAMKGLSYDSEFLGSFYMIVANDRDILGKPQDAVNAYQKAIEYSPDDAMLYYNLGITYYGKGELEKAEANFIKGIQLNPNHPSGHLALGDLYLNQGDHIPSIFLMCRFLILEPKTL